MKKTFVVALTLSAASPAQATNLWGVQAHMLDTDRFFPGLSNNWAPQGTLPLTKSLGVTWIRDLIGAYYTAPQQFVSLPNASASTASAIAANRAVVDGYYSLYDKAGNRVILTILAQSPTVKSYNLLNADFASWLAKLVEKHPSIYALELGNEAASNSSNWSGFNYVKAYAPIVSTVRAARPGIKILGGGGSSWWWSVSFYKQAFAAGLMDFVDGFSLHPYNGGNVPPEVDVEFHGNGDWEQSQIQQWAQFQSFNTSRKPLELDFTELGYASVSGTTDSVPDQTMQAAYLSRLMIETQDIYVQGVPVNSAEWYELIDSSNPSLDKPPNFQHNFGLYNYNLTKAKLSFLAYKTWIAAFPNKADIVAVPGLEATPDRNASAVESRVWQRKTDRAIIAPYWRLNQVTAVSADFNGYLSVTLPAGMKAKKVTLQQACGGSAYPKFTQTGSVVKFEASFKMCACWATIQ